LVIQDQLARESSDRRSQAAKATAADPTFRLIEFPFNRQHVRIGSGTSRLEGTAKRAIDFCIALTLLIALSPLLLITAAAVRFESRGPALFRQQRLGLHGKPFRIVKFRTMHVLEDGEEIRQAAPDDRRVTRVGRFLRTSSLDELPQFINVIRGEMSLVGPRPHAVAHDKQFGALITNYALRRRVRPGITGWAQVNGFRGATPTVDAMRRRVDHDIWYVQNASVRLDLEILLRTPGEMLRRRNAY
jgi:putative colanic acid biosynthesis UDP-glucose lipid carrier transferase